MWPLTSIVMPAYNAARTIGDSLDSALGQSVAELELIVVDDGSTDETARIVRSRNDPRIQLVSTAHRGVSHARNVGLRAAAGEFIQYLDADDVLDERKIEMQLRRLEDSPRDCSAVCAWGRFHDSPEDARMVRAADWRDLDPFEHLRLNLGGGGTMPVFTWLIPRPLADAVGPWREELSLREDAEYFTRVALASGRILFCEDSRGYYRSGRETSLSRRRSTDCARSILLGTRLIEKAFLDAHGGREDSRSIVADLYRRGAIELFQFRPGLAIAAEKSVARLGGSSLTPSPGGPARRVVTRLLGWRICMILICLRDQLLRGLPRRSAGRRDEPPHG